MSDELKKILKLRATKTGDIKGIELPSDFKGQIGEFAVVVLDKTKDKITIVAVDTKKLLESVKSGLKAT